MNLASKCNLLACIVDGTWNSEITNNKYLSAKNNTLDQGYHTPRL